MKANWALCIGISTKNCEDTYFSNDCIITMGGGKYYVYGGSSFSFHTGDSVGIFFDEPSLECSFYKDKLLIGKSTLKSENTYSLVFHFYYKNDSISIKQEALPGFLLK
jgi:hypothetical protein